MVEVSTLQVKAGALKNVGCDSQVEPQHCNVHTLALTLNTLSKGSIINNLIFNIGCKCRCCPMNILRDKLEIT